MYSLASVTVLFDLLMWGGIAIPFILSLFILTREFVYRKNDIMPLAQEAWPRLSSPAVDRATSLDDAIDETQLAA